MKAAMSCGPRPMKSSITSVCKLLESVNGAVTAEGFLSWGSEFSSLQPISPMKQLERALNKPYVESGYLQNRSHSRD